MTLLMRESARYPALIEDLKQVKGVSFLESFQELIGKVVVPNRLAHRQCCYSGCELIQRPDLRETSSHL